MRYLPSSLSGLVAIVAVACSGDNTDAASGIGTHDGGASGGVTGTQCRTIADCPALGCFGCGSTCVNGHCVSTFFGGSGGAIPVASGGFAGSSGGAGAGGVGGAGAGGAPAIPACGAAAPAGGATCDPSVNGVCRLGGLHCSCTCQCGNLCANVPSPCSCPPPPASTCSWGCFFVDFDALFDPQSLNISLDCSNPSAARITVSVAAGLRADADGPPLTVSQFQPIVAGADFRCTLPQATATVGPIAPGSEQMTTFTVGPTNCIGGSGKNAPDALCAACGTSAGVTFSLALNVGGSAREASGGYYFTVGSSPTNSAGTQFPIACTH